MSAPQWSGPVVYCKECGMQKHPEMRCLSEKCNKEDRMTESEKKAREIASELSACYTDHGCLHQEGAATIIARRLEEYANERLEEAAKACDDNCWVVDRGSGIVSKASNVIRALKREEER